MAWRIHVCFRKRCLFFHTYLNEFSSSDFFVGVPVALLITAHTTVLALNFGQYLSGLLAAYELCSLSCAAAVEACDMQYI